MKIDLAVWTERAFLWAVVVLFVASFVAYFASDRFVCAYNIYGDYNCPELEGG